MKIQLNPQQLGQFQEKLTKNQIFMLIKIIIIKNNKKCMNNQKSKIGFKNQNQKIKKLRIIN